MRTWWPCTKYFLLLFYTFLLLLRPKHFSRKRKKNQFNALSNDYNPIESIKFSIINYYWVSTEHNTEYTLHKICVGRNRLCETLRARVDWEWKRKRRQQSLFAKIIIVKFDSKKKCFPHCCCHITCARSTFLCQTCTKNDGEEKTLIFWRFFVILFIEWKKTCYLNSLYTQKYFRWLLLLLLLLLLGQYFWGRRWKYNQNVFRLLKNKILKVHLIFFHNGQLQGRKQINYLVE